MALDDVRLIATRIEVATRVMLPSLPDTHPTDLPFPDLSDPDQYRGLYGDLLWRAMPYANAVTGAPGEVLHKMYAFPRDYPIWTQYLDDAYYQDYADSAWDRLLPVRASIRPRVAFTQPAALSARGVTVRLKPSILVHPLGWLVWLSFLVSGDHNMDDVRAVVSDAVTGASYRLVNTPSAGQSRPQLAGELTLRRLDEQLAAGLRSDIAGSTVPARSGDVLHVTTVTRASGYVSSGALTAAQRDLLFDVAWPDRRGRAMPGDPITVRSGQPHNFIVQSPFGRLLWIGPLVNPNEVSNARDLDCYHKNTWNSLVLAWIHSGVFDVAARPECGARALELARGNTLWYRASPAGTPEVRSTWWGNASLKRFVADHRLPARASAVP